VLSVQAEWCVSLSHAGRPVNDRSAPCAGICQAVSMEIGDESVSRMRSCTDGIQVMRLEPTEMEVSHDVKLSVHSAHEEAEVVSDPKVEKLDATMNHFIDVTSYPHTSEPDDQLNASVMIDPSNPFDDEMIKRLLSKLAQPLSSYENYHCVNANLPRICVRGSIQLGMFYAALSKISLILLLVIYVVVEIIGKISCF